MAFTHTVEFEMRMIYHMFDVLVVERDGGFQFGPWPIIACHFSSFQ